MSDINKRALDQIIAYEQGEMDHDEIVTFFQEIFDNGIVFNLQGHYQRTLNNLIQNGDVIVARNNT